MQDLEGKLIHTTSGEQYLLTELAGEGAQGVVYNEASDKYLIKLYKNGTPIQNKNKIRKLTWLMEQDYPDQFDKYKNNEVNLVFATNAFGMGIDIPDIRVVIHFMITESVEQYYQEVGRAARDGHGANAYLLYSNKNIDVKKQYFIDRSFPTEEKLRSVYQKIATNTGYQTLAYFEDDEIQQCLPYFMMCGLIQIEGKGFADLASVTNITDDTLQMYYDSTKKKGFIRTMKKCDIKPKELSECVYKSYVNDNAELIKPLERWLILNIFNNEVDDDSMNLILKDIEEKKQYKHELLDYLVYVIENNLNTLHLHQEIAAYLGTEKHNLALIYETADGKGLCGCDC